MAKVLFIPICIYESRSLTILSKNDKIFTKKDKGESSLWQATKQWSCTAETKCAENTKGGASFAPPKFFIPAKP